MTNTLAGYPIARATLRVPRYGAPFAEIALVEEPALAAGQRADLAIGDLTMTGTLRPGGSFGGTQWWSWTGGAGRWETEVQERGYDDDSGIKLSLVFGDLVQDAREFGGALGTVDRVLATRWTRPRMLARDALESLVGSAWWVDAAGVTHAGPRPSSAVAPPSLVFPDYNPELRWGRAALPDDALAQLQPGAVVTAPGLPSALTVSQLVAHVDADRIEVELFGERPLAELLGAMIDARTRGTRFHALAPYAVKNVAGARSSVEPNDARSVILPGHAYLDQIPGVPGMTAVLQAGAGVLVGWPSGDPGSPAIVAYMPGVLPASLLFDAAGDIALGAGAGPLAKGIACNVNFNAIAAALAALGQPVTMVNVSTTKAKGA